jgi:hypothetical protein
VTTFVLASLAALGNIIVILTWFGIKPNHVFSATSWAVRTVTVSGRALVLVFALAVFSLGLSSYGLYRIYFGQVRTPSVVQWGSDNKNHCLLVVDTSSIADMADKYYIVAACGVIDPSVEIMNDKRISISDAFYIVGRQQSFQINMSQDMINEFAALRTEGEPSISLWAKTFAFPKNKDISKVRTLADIATFGGILY